MADDWDLSCTDWEDRIRTGRSLMPSGLPLIAEQAERAVRCFDRLRVPDVAGRPTFAEAAGDWQRDIVRALFGSYDPVAEERYIRELFLLVPKKNAKTTFVAAIMLTTVLVNIRPLAEYLIVGATQHIADLGYRQVEGMLDADPFLARRFQVQSHIKRITYLPTGASLSVKSFDPKVLTGAKPAGAMLDEEHVAAANSDADRVMGQLRGGMVSQPEAFLAIVTTQSERPPAGIFRADLNRARSIRDGGENAGRMLPVIYELPRDLQKPGIAGGAAPWENPECWRMVTPNAGRSITVDRLVPDFATAKQAGEGELRRWASQHLNVEIGLALGSDRWAGADYWESQADSGLTLDEVIDRSEVLVVGVDGGGLDDLLSIAVLGRERGTMDWLHWQQSWAHDSVLERRKAEAPRLRDFERAKELVILSEPGADIEQLAAIVGRVLASGKLAMVGLDPMGVGAIVDALTEIGVPREHIHGVSQGWTLTGAIKTAERKLADGSLIHGGAAIMAWAVGNAKVEARGNAVVITKQAAGSAKIDPLMALFAAVVLMTKSPQAKPTAERLLKRGILVA